MAQKTKPAAVLSDAEVRAALSRDLSAWTLADGTIRRTFRTHGWKGTLMLVTTIGHLAEAAWHHPDLLVSYDKVEIRLSTHSEKGVTAKDLALAAKIEDVVTWRPGEEAGGPLDGTPGDPRYAYVRYEG
jgi:4a-hydroxytetrahydrobiopterin dehydratase